MMSTLQSRRDDILQYLAIHPDAADTVEGIARWWLTWDDHDEPVLLVLKALDDLVQEGLVKKMVLAGGTVLYRAGGHSGPA